MSPFFKLNQGTIKSKEDGRNTKFLKAWKLNDLQYLVVRDDSSNSFF